MDQHGLQLPFRPPEQLAKDRDYELQARLYAVRSLPSPPSQPNQRTQHIRRKPVSPDARLVTGGPSQFPMASHDRPGHAHQQALDSRSTQSRSTGSSIPKTEATSPPPKSPLRYARYSSPSTPSPTGASHRRRQSSKVHQLTGIDIDVFDDSPWKYGHFQMDAVSDSSSVYSQESTNGTARMKSWHTMSDEVPPLDRDKDGQPSRMQSWGPKSLPGSASLGQPPASSLRRQPRTKRRSRDAHVLDNYHRIVTDLASPTARHSAPDLLADIDTRSDGMPADFDVILNEPREAPRPPPLLVGPDGERLGSYFDANSEDEDEEAGIFAPIGHRRDSFLGMLLGSGLHVPPHHHHHHQSRSASVSTGAGRASSDLEDGLSDSAAAEISQAGKSSGKAALRGLVEWAKKNSRVDESERRRQELKQKIVIQGGRTL